MVWRGSLGNRSMMFTWQFLLLFLLAVDWVEDAHYGQSPWPARSIVPMNYGRNISLTTRHLSRRVILSRLNIYTIA
jgi:hypothetical protein